jgi:hypothetical protein
MLQRGQTSTSRALGSRVQSCRTPLVAHGTCAEHGKSLSTFSMHSCRLCHHLHVEHCNATLGCWCYAERITPMRHSRLSEHRWKAATMLSACKAANFPAWLPRVFVWTSCLGFTTDGIGNTCQNRRRRNIDLAVSAHLQCDTVDGMFVTLTCDPFKSGMLFPYSRRASE